MVKKIKIFDSFVFKDELNLLEFRLTELDPYVNHFIIVELISDEKNSLFIKEKDRFKKWDKKISHIFVTEQELSFLNKITIEFINCEPNFEDVLMISQINEVPNLEQKDEILNLLNYGPIIIKHQNFVWNIDFIDNNWVDGTTICNFSSILINKKITQHLFESKNNPKTTIQKLKNGWSFSNFYYDNKFEFQVQEKLPPTYVDSITTYPLTNHQNKIQLPINFKLLPYNNLERIESKLHLFLVDSEDIEISQEQYDSISVINFTSNLDEKLNEYVSDKIKKHTLYLPSKILYLNNLDEFQTDYKMNEIKRMVHTLFLKKQDKLTIYYKNTLL